MYLGDIEGVKSMFLGLFISHHLDVHCPGGLEWKNETWEWENETWEWKMRYMYTMQNSINILAVFIFHLERFHCITYDVSRKRAGN